MHSLAGSAATSATVCRPLWQGVLNMDKSCTLPQVNVAVPWSDPEELAVGALQHMRQLLSTQT